MRAIGLSKENNKDTECSTVSSGGCDVVLRNTVEKYQNGLQNVRISHCVDAHAAKYCCVIGTSLKESHVSELVERNHVIVNRWLFVCSKISCDIKNLLRVNLNV